MQKTTLAKSGEISRPWVLVNLKGCVLGRAATQIADLLRGKKSVLYTPHEDAGNFVVAINASQIRLTGKKLTDKIYYHHTGYIGGIKEASAGQILQKKPEELIRLAVRGMLPKNKSQKHFLKKLHIYAGSEHPHVAQRPKEVAV